MKSFTEEEIDKIKHIQGSRWVPDERIWTIPYTQLAVEQLLHHFHERQVHISPPLKLEQEFYGAKVRVLTDGEADVRERDSGIPLFNLQNEQKLKEQLKRGVMVQNMKHRAI